MNKIVYARCTEQGFFLELFTINEDQFVQDSIVTDDGTEELTYTDDEGKEQTLFYLDSEHIDMEVY